MSYKLVNKNILRNTIEPISISSDVISEIKMTVGKYKPETGGILLANHQGIIVKFILDKGGSSSPGAYDPDYKGLNQVLKKEEKNGLTYVGSIHSHPRGIQYPSQDMGNNIGDHGAFKANLECNPEIDKFYGLIAYSTYDGGKFKIFPYVINREKPDTIYVTSIKTINKTNKTQYEFEQVFNNERLNGGVDLSLMEKSKIVVVGVGWANKIIESLVRTNVRNIICIDFDIVANHNLSSQGWYLEDIGSYKVDALEKRLKKINPDINYQGISKNLFDLSDEEIYTVFDNADLILGMTDSFSAQVRINEISIASKTPAIFALMYYKGVACEITFNIPDISELNHRDAVIERYQANYETEIESVTSSGGTIFQTEYLNSAIGILALNILHRNSENNHYSGLFNTGFKRNFIQLRMHKSYSSSPGNMFYEASRSNKGVGFFDAIWRDVVPANQNDEVEITDKDWSFENEYNLGYFKALFSQNRSKELGLWS